MEILRQRSVLSRVEDALDRLEDFADVTESIVVKTV
jgi:uncharacterized protein Yka (UPF0111/DUF47 family)